MRLTFSICSDMWVTMVDGDAHCQCRTWKWYDGFNVSFQFLWFFSKLFIICCLLILHFYPSVIFYFCMNGKTEFVCNIFINASRKLICETFAIYLFASHIYERNEKKNKATKKTPSATKIINTMIKFLIFSCNHKSCITFFTVSQMNSLLFILLSIFYSSHNTYFLRLLWGTNS